MLYNCKITFLFDSVTIPLSEQEICYVYSVLLIFNRFSLVFKTLTNLRLLRRKYGLRRIRKYIARRKSEQTEQS